MSNKEMAITFLKMAGSGDVRQAFDKFIAPKFIHHNQYFKGDRLSLILAMEEAHLASPNKSIDIKQAFEDGDTVITHSHVIRQDPNEQDVAVVHIFRFVKHQIVELWDLGQLLDKDSPNEHGAF